MRGTSGGFDSLDAAADAIAAYLPHRTRPKDQSGLQRNLRQAEDGRYYWRWDPQFIKPRESWEMDETRRRLEAAVKAIHAPMLLVRGERSEIVSGDILNEFRELNPAVEIQEIAGARHMVAGDDNRAFESAVVSFIQRRVGSDHAG